jgi:hypothetical protein
VAASEPFLTYSRFTFAHRPREVTMSGDRKPLASDPSNNAQVSRRGFLNIACGGTAVMGLVSLAMPRAARAQYWDYGANVWKSRARYQNYPIGPARCAGCLHFRPPAACEVVEPLINPNGWCRYFSPIPLIYAPPDYPERYDHVPAYPRPYYPPASYPPYWRRPPGY